MSKFFALFKYGFVLEKKNNNNQHLCEYEFTIRTSVGTAYMFFSLSQKNVILNVTTCGVQCACRVSVELYLHAETGYPEIENYPAPNAMKPTKYLHFFSVQMRFTYVELKLSTGDNITTWQSIVYVVQMK